jgi:hexosaminidase
MLPKKLLPLALLGAAFLAHAGRSAPLPALMPLPAELRAGAGQLAIDPDFNYTIMGAADARVPAAIDRLLGQWARRTDIAYSGHPVAAAQARLVIDCARTSPAIPRLGEDESYTLEVTEKQAVLRAPTTTGALRGLATLTQLLSVEDGHGFLPAVSISDRPRFAWRGLLVDVARHWQPAAVLRRQLDAMALVKLNVLHLHLTDDQGFRIESRTHPELHRLGSDGNFFTQDEMRGLIAYAAERGIRLMPEFDVPGHSTSWVVSHPELASAPGPYTLCRRWGVEHPVLDPTNESTYVLLDDFLGEMAGLFPDEFLHIGGDENDGVHWSANARIQDFIRAHDLKDNPGLHAWFNRRLLGRFIGWDEILHPDLPADSAIHSWRGPEGVVAAAKAGHAVLLSNGYYIDLNQPAAEHYAVDPLPADTPLTPAQQALVLGGEATMWSEWVTPANIDTRIWPRTAPIAERLWSPRSVNDPADMYRRMAALEPRLAEAGVTSAAWPRFDFPALDPRGPVLAALRTLALAVEPVKVYRRGALQPETGQTTPLNDLADWARPESRPARDFGTALERWLLADGPISAPGSAPLRAQLRAWVEAGDLAAQAPAAATPRAQGRVRTAHALAELGRLGGEAIDALLTGKPAPTDWGARARQTLAAAEPNAAAVEFPFLPQLRLLAAAATIDPAARTALPRAEWRRQLETAYPAPKPAE